MEKISRAQEKEAKKWEKLWRTTNAVCKKCIHKCKQKAAVIVTVCPSYEDKKGNKSFNKIKQERFK